MGKLLGRVDRIAVPLDTVRLGIEVVFYLVRMGTL